VLAKDPGAGRDSAQQFHPPSGIWPSHKPLHYLVDVNAQIGTDQDGAGVDAAVDLPAKNGNPSSSHRQLRPGVLSRASPAFARGTPR
jgi:hypothetical protein